MPRDLKNLTDGFSTYDSQNLGEIGMNELNFNSNDVMQIELASGQAIQEISTTAKQKKC